MEMNKYVFKQKYGIDDLECECAFVGNSQGDETRTNSIKEYEAADGWLSYTFGPNVPMTPEAIEAEVARRKKKNKEYIERLKSQGRYGEEYEVTIHVTPNSILDQGARETSLESYQMYFIDPITGKKIK